MPGPRVTVLMAVHNNAPYLQEAIDSILAQTIHDLELIVVDDGSTDASWSIITKAAEVDSRLIARRRPVNGGASLALNEALALARGRYITRQDGDDVSPPSRLAEQVAFLEAHGDTAGVGTQATLVDASGATLSVTSFPTEASAIDALLLESMCFVGPTVMARRDAWQKAGLWFDDELSGTEDYDLCLRLAEVGPLANLATPVYLYRQHAASVSHRRRHQQLARKARAVENAVRRRHGADPPPDAWIDVARDFLRAGVVAYVAGDAGATQEWLRRAVEFSPGLFNDGRLVESVVRRYLVQAPEASRLTLAGGLFDEAFPRTRGMRRLRKRLTGELHLSALMTEREGSRSVTGHLWPVVCSSPSRLLRPGVLARLVKYAVGRG